MIEILKIIRIAGEARQSSVTEDDRKKAMAILAWQKKTLEEAKKAGGEFVPSVQALSDYITCDQGDAMARMYATRMLVEAQLEWFVFDSINDWLTCINYVVQRAPNFKPDEDHFPLSKLFVFFMFTPAGASLFRMKEFNVRLTAVLKAWCDYLDTEDSKIVLNPTGEIPATEGWLSHEGEQDFCLQQCVNYKNKGTEPYWGFTSYNDFFHRKIKLNELRPMDPADDVIVSSVDGTVYRIATEVEKCTAFWTKGQNYSLVNMLDNSKYTDDFVGGDVMQSFLDGSDYHRWHAPISGTIVEARVIEGLTFSELLSEGLDLSAGTESQGYEATVNTRGLIIIHNETYGKVAVVPTGITEISSIIINKDILDAMKEKRTIEIKKGEELGYFSYGGSSMALVFQKDMINEFLVKVPGPEDKIPTCKNPEDCKPADGCLLVRGAIATVKK